MLQKVVVGGEIYILFIFRDLIISSYELGGNPIHLLFKNKIVKNRVQAI